MTWMSANNRIDSNQSTIKWYIWRVMWHGICGWCGIEKRKMRMTRGVRLEETEVKCHTIVTRGRGCKLKHRLRHTCRGRSSCKMLECYSNTGFSLPSLKRRIEDFLFVKWLKSGIFCVELTWLYSNAYSGTAACILHTFVTYIGANNTHTRGTQKPLHPCWNYWFVAFVFISHKLKK